MRARRAISHGFTLVELLVVIAIIGVLAGLMFPAFAQGRGKARAIVCMANLHQMVLAAQMYGQDHDQIWAHHGVWQGGTDAGCPLLRRYGLSQESMTCPAFRARPWRRIAGCMLVGYSYNIFLDGLPDASVEYPGTTVVFFDAGLGILALSGPDRFDDPTLPYEAGAWRHDGGANYAFADGHVRWYRPEAVRDGHEGPNDGYRPSFSPW
jgi:prepilin-type N-terminal cleavage/methylation domain-containing protein/prepilin-type processing-associated H-X9-DG protein